MTDRGYGRISLDTLRSGSITKQRDRIEAFAGRDFEWYVDESVSGAKVPFSERPGASRLLNDLQAGDRVLVTKIDRAARSVPDLLSLVKFIEEQKKCSIVFVDQNIDTSGAFGRFFLVLLAAIAELEAAIVAERRMESLESFKAEGRHAVGKAPVGFISVDNPDGRGLVIRPDPETAGDVKEAVRRVMRGESQETVRHMLNMSKTGFHKLLHNPRLAGMTPEGVYETYEDPKSGKQKSRLVETGVVSIDGIPKVDADSAILTMAEWRGLQDYLEKPDKQWSRREGYGAALLCGVCRERMYVNVSKRSNKATGETHDTYVCSKTKHDNREAAPSVMKHRADAYLEETFLDLLGERRALVPSWSTSADGRLEAISAAQVQLQEAQRRFSSADDDEGEAEALAAMQKAKRALREAVAMPSERVFKVEETGLTVRETWEAADADGRSRLLKRAGKWVLSMGRAPIDRRITLERDDLLLELSTHRVESQSDTYDDSGGFLM